MDLSEIVSSRLNELFGNEKETQIAGKLNMTQGNLNKIKNGKQALTIDNLRRISELYHVSTDWILGLKDDRDPDSINVDKLDYCQVFTILDKLQESKTIIPAKTSEIVVDNDYGDEDDDAGNKSEISTKGIDYDLLKINDPTISFMLRRRMKLIDVEQSLYEDWKEKHLPEFRGLVLLECDDALKDYMNNHRTGNSDGDWSSSLAEYIDQKKSSEGKK